MWNFLTTHFDAIRDGAAVVGVVYLTWMVARHGVAWVWTKVQSAYLSAKSDVSGVGGRLEALEANVAALHKGTGVAPVAPIPAVAQAVAAVVQTTPVVAAH